MVEFPRLTCLLAAWACVLLTSPSALAQPCLVVQDPAPGGVTPGEPIPNVQPRWPVQGMVFDSARNKVVAYGADFGPRIYEYNGSAWTRLDLPYEVPGQYSPAMAYDAARQKTLIYGGLLADDLLATPTNALRTWDGTTLADIPPTPAPGSWPPATASARRRAAYDPIRQRTIFVISPVSGPTHIWEWTGSAWEQGPQVPDSFTVDGVAFDTLQGRLFMAGYNTATIDEAAMAYLPGPTAAQGTVVPLAIQGQGFSGFVAYAYAYDSLHHRVFRVGGQAYGQPVAYNTVHVWDPAASTWVRTFASSAGDLLNRAGPHAAFDSVRGRVVVYGGTTQGASPGSSVEQRTTREVFLNRDPVILQQPISRTNLCSGSNSALSFVPQVVDGISYQWWRRAPGALGFAPVPGATSTVFPPNRPVQASDTGTYLCEVRVAPAPAGGGLPQFCGVAFTTPVDLTVFDPPAIGTPQWQATAVCPGGAVQVAVPGVTGSGVTIRLQKRTAAQSWVDVATTTPGEPFFALSNLGPADTGDYRVQAVNPCSEANSPATRLQVGASITGAIGVLGAVAPCSSILIRPLAGLDPSGVSAVGTLTLRWYRDGQPLSDDARITGSTTSSLSISNLAYADTGDYELRVTDSACPGAEDRRTYTLALPQPPAAYVQRSLPGPVPQPREYHAMAYDASRGVVVLFGGLGRDQFGQTIGLGDTWEYDGQSWTLKNPAASPGLVWAHAMVYDSTRQKVLLYGGRYANCPTGCVAPSRSQLWEWDGTNWTFAWTFNALGGPADSRAGFPAVAYDSQAQRLVLYTGENPSTDIYQGQTWEYNPAAASWVQRSAAGPTTSSGYPAMYYDTRRNRRVMYAFAAFSTFPATLFPAMYEWSGTQWATTAADLSGAWQFNQQLFPYQPFATGTWAYNTLMRTGETGLGLVTAPGGGGSWGGTYTYAGPPDDPVRVSIANGFARQGAAQVWDSARRCMVIFGGQDLFPNSPANSRPTATTIERHFLEAPVVLEQPQSATRCGSAAPGPVTLRTLAVGAPSLSFQWQRLDPPGAGPGTWTNLSDGPLVIGGATWGIISGSGTPLLQAQPDPLASSIARTLQFRCTVSNACGTTSSTTATLTTSCPNKADVAGLGGSPGCDGQLTTDDLIFYLEQFFANNAAVADLVGLGGAGGPDGLITADDLVAFLSAFFVGCP